MWQGEVVPNLNHRRQAPCFAPRPVTYWLEKQSPVKKTKPIKLEKHT